MRKRRSAAISAPMPMRARSRNGVLRERTIAGGATDAAIEKFIHEIGAGPTGARRMHRMAVLIAHQRKAPVQHAAIGQGGEKLTAVGDPRIEPLQQGAERAVG